MGRRSFAVRDITEILIHWQAGRPLRQIADSLGVDRNTVRKYVALAVRLGYRPGEPRLSAPGMGRYHRSTRPRSS